MHDAHILTLATYQLASYDKLNKIDYYVILLIEFFKMSSFKLENG